MEKLLSHECDSLHSVQVFIGINRTCIVHHNMMPFTIACSSHAGVSKIIKWNLMCSAQMEVCRSAQVHGRAIPSQGTTLVRHLRTPSQLYCAHYYIFPSWPVLFSCITPSQVLWGIVRGLVNGHMCNFTCIHVCKYIFFTGDCRCWSRSHWSWWKMN